MTELIAALRAHVAGLCSEACAGRAPRTRESAAAREIIVASLRA